MTVSHLDRVCEIEQQCFVHPWSRESIEAELNNENSLFLVACENDRVIGYIGMNFVIDEGYIYNVAVDEKYRHNGVATALINELVVYAKKNNFCFLTLEVRQSNTAAQSLYEGFGFCRVGLRPNFYRDPKEDAVLMTLFLNE